MSESLEVGEHDPPNYRAYGPQCAGCRTVHAWKKDATEEQLVLSRIYLERDPDDDG